MVRPEDLDEARVGSGGDAEDDLGSWGGRRGDEDRGRDRWIGPALSCAPPLRRPSRPADAESLLVGSGGHPAPGARRVRAFRSRGRSGLACAGTVDMRAGGGGDLPQPASGRRPAGVDAAGALGVPVVLENDGNAAVLAEASAGAAVGLRNVVMLTLGTGVGGGLFLDGRVYRGACGRGGRAGAHGRADGWPAVSVRQPWLPGDVRLGAGLWRGTRVRGRETGKRDPDGALLAMRETGRAERRGGRQNWPGKGHPGALEAVRQLADWLGIGLVKSSNTFDSGDDRRGRRRGRAGRTAPGSGPRVHAQERHGART